MAGGIPQEAVATSAVVLIYSFICLTLVTLLVCLLVSFGERWTFVTIFSAFTALSTLGSIIQQFHYAFDWRVIKQAQFDQAVKSLSHPGLAFGGAAEKADIILFNIQFYSYNVMSLNILFWAVTLFIGAWGIRSNWLGDWYDRVPIISKAFAIVYPILIVGLMQIDPIINSLPAFFIVSNITLLLSMAIGTVLLILILYKYMKTRRLVMGSGRRGKWWASGSSKDRSQTDFGTNGTDRSGVASSTRQSIYDRALVTRFTIGFGILVVFEIAIIIFNLFQLNNNRTLAASGGPNLDPGGAIVDLLFFIPGVTASLVAFLVFGTTKSWRQYRDFVYGGCGLVRRMKQRRRRSDEEGNHDQSLEFQRLPSLTRRASEEQRKREREAAERIKNFARESTVSEVTDFAESVHTSGPSNRSGDPQVARVVQFHRTMHSQSMNKPAKPNASSEISEVGLSIQHDPVIQRDVEKTYDDAQQQTREPSRFVNSQPSRAPRDFLEDQND
ncbi:hypothetical protein B0J14DRAFT_33301 [Halenospora varia]|nr:hypothetical protein B0J14DRAFT_33301 [Halenospora varia]